MFRPAAVLWDGHDVHVLLEGAPADVEAQGRAMTAATAPAFPSGPHRGRISIAPGAIRALAPDLTGTGVRWCAELGVGTVHVAADSADALRAARVAAHAHGGWMLREAGGNGIDGFGRPVPNAALMQRIKHAFDPDRQARTGPAPAVSAPVTPKSTTPLDLDEDDARRVRRVRAVPPALPDVPRDRPRDRVAARSHRGDARASSNGARRSTTRSSVRWTNACSAGAARPRARPACSSDTSWKTTRSAVLPRPPYRPFPRRAVEWFAYRVVLPHHAVLLALTWCVLVGQRLHLVPQRFGIPRLRPRSLRRLDVAEGGEPDAWLFTGCVMDAWMRDTHRATARVMRAAGARDRTTGIARRRAAERCTCTPVATKKHARSLDA